MQFFKMCLLSMSMREGKTFFFLIKQDWRDSIRAMQKAFMAEGPISQV